ncbi:MAG: molybdopterin-dependent oxidoreductase [Firmicutes bacterium]|nr:molybdopterin-dependent oxidoreductase [Bacillota bacterium]
MARVSFQLNGKPHQAEYQPGTTLLRYLRDEMQLTGTKEGCSRGECGSCTVLIDGKTRKACIVGMKSLAGVSVETIESVNGDGLLLHPLVAGFSRAGAVQCGFCTPGMIMAAKALLAENPDPSPDRIKAALAENYCRCTGYARIIRAVQDAAADLRGGCPPAGQPERELPGRGIYGTDVLGAEIPEDDFAERACGKTLFTDDIYRADQLVARPYLAPHPHAVIEDIDLTEALRVPGVAAILTARDVPGPNRFGRFVKDRPILADGKVRFDGEPVAVILAENRRAADEALKLIRVGFRPLPVISSVEEALAEGAPLVHEWGAVVARAVNRAGDAEEAFSRSEIVRVGTYRVPFQAHGFLEPEAAFAEPDGEGGVIICSPTQLPTHVQNVVSENLCLPKEKVRVKSMPVGGAFGGKNDVMLEAFVALGALKTGRPVKMTLNRRESQRFGTKAHGATIEIKVGATGDGKLTGLKAAMTLDSGAYAAVSPLLVQHSTMLAAGPYAWTAYDIEVKAVSTNNVIGSAFRGFGSERFNFALESQIELIARELSIDPFDFRLQNLVQRGTRLASGQVMGGSVPVARTLIKAREILAGTDLPQPGPGKRIGVGIACAHKSVAFGLGFEEWAEVNIEPASDGTLRVTASVVDIGQGIRSGMAQIISAVTGIRPELIRVSHADTAVVGGAIGVAQRQTYIAGNAVRETARLFLGRIRTFLAGEFGLTPDGIEILGDRIVYRREGEEQPLLEFAALPALARRRGEDLRLTHRYQGPATTAPWVEVDVKGPSLRWRAEDSGVVERPRPAYSGDGTDEIPPVWLGLTYYFQVAVVEVDERTGKVRPLKIIAVQDAGRAINPDRIRANAEGGCVMGAGMALAEEVQMHGGRVLSDTFRKMKMPSALEAPEVEVQIIEDPDPYGPFGAKGLAEGSLVATIPAVVNAVCNATGGRIRELPASPDRVLKSLKGLIE